MYLILHLQRPFYNGSLLLCTVMAILSFQRTVMSKYHKMDKNKYMNIYRVPQNLLNKYTDATLIVVTFEKYSLMLSSP